MHVIKCVILNVLLNKPKNSRKLTIFLLMYLFILSYNLYARWTNEDVGGS